MGRTYRRDKDRPSKKYKRTKKAKKKEKSVDGKEKSKDAPYFWWDNHDYGGKDNFERLSGRRNK